MFKKVIKAAYESVNGNHRGAKLKNLWNYFNTDQSISPYCDFVD